MTITRSGWTTIMVDSCTPLIATASALYATGSATAVHNGSHLVFSAAREVDGAGFVAQVAAGIDNSFEFNIAKVDSRSPDGVLVTVLETIDNVQYVIGGGRLQFGPKQRINFRSTGNNVSLLFTGPFNMVELAQVCTKYPKSVQHTYLVDVCDEDKDRYRFGFNGQEKVNEIAGVGNHNTAEFWEYDTRLGRRWNLDPKPNESISSYAAFQNNPIRLYDINGDTVNVSSSITGNIVLKSGYDAWATSNEGKAFLKDYEIGGKYEHVSLNFEASNTGNNTHTQIIQGDGKSFDVETNMIIKNSDKLVDGKIPGAYLKYTINIQSSISGRQFEYQNLPNKEYFENITYLNAETFLHESQHVRISMESLVKKTPQPSEYIHHEMMKDKSSKYYRERENFFKWGTSFFYQMRNSKDAKLNDFRMGGYYEDKKPIRVIQVK